MYGACEGYLPVCPGPIIYNNIIRYNYAEYGGGGISYGHGGIGVIANNTVYGNWGRTGGGFYDYGGPGTVVLNCIFWGDGADSSNEISGPATISYCDVQGGWPGEGNIDSDPLFRNPAGGDFHLMAVQCGDTTDSPCIDAGHPDSLDLWLDCNNGLGTVRADMGAYGGRGWGLVGIVESQPIPRSPSILLQNHPNPFNSSTTIRFEISEPGLVKLELFNILGQRVRTFFREDRLAGAYQVIWNGRGDNGEEVASGVYFARLSAGDRVETRKMMLLR